MVEEQRKVTRNTMSKFLRGSHMYDLIIIGGGSGGVRASRIAASHGAKVALIESSMHHGPPDFSAIGGTCVNVGCVPKKLMVYASHFSEAHHGGEGYGWSAVSSTFDWNKFMVKKNEEISRLNGVYGRMLGGAGVEIIEGKGSFKNHHEILIEKKDGTSSVISGETIVISVGGWPFKPSLKGIEHAITSNEIFYLKEQPKRVVVVGGGYIAVEFACILHGLGSEVNLLYRGELFLRGFDLDIRKHLEKQMDSCGVQLHFKSNPQEIKKNADGTLTVITEKGESYECDAVLYATGRVAKTDNLGLDNTDVKTSNGFIPVDAGSKTNVDNIYAVGDVTDRIALTPVALHEGHCLADTLYGGKTRKPDHEYVTSAVFSNPEIATVGYTEEAAASAFQNISVYTSEFRPMSNILSGSPLRAFMKIIVDDATDRVVGVHVCCDHAAEIMQGVGIAVKTGASKADFDATIGIHPTSAEELVTMRTPSYKYKNGAKL